MSEVNYKRKYIELRTKFISSVDVAFRLGVEQGMQQAQVQQAQQQQADAQAMQQAAAGGQPGQPGEGGAPGEEGGQPGEQPGNPASEHPEGSELDQHISQLEQAMGKAEHEHELYKDLKKSLDGFKAIKASYEHAAMLRKNDAAIRTITKNMNKHKLAPRAMNERARNNLSSQQKSTLDLQQKIVDDMFKSWDAEETDMVGKVLEAIGNEGKLKKE